MQDERQFLIIHHDRLGGIERLGLGFRHHGGDRLADMACLVGGEQQVRADEHRAAARRMQLHVEFGFWQRVVRNGIEPGGQAISPAEGRNDARQRARGGKVHVTDARMRMRRPHHRQVTLAGDGKIVAEATGAGGQPRVLLARQRRADEAEVFGGFGLLHDREGKEP